MLPQTNSVESFETEWIGDVYGQQVRDLEGLLYSIGCNTSNIVDKMQPLIRSNISLSVHLQQVRVSQRSQGEYPRDVQDSPS
jgi:hypothetical protein